MNIWSSERMLQYIHNTVGEVGVKEAWFLCTDWAVFEELNLFWTVSPRHKHRETHSSTNSCPHSFFPSFDGKPNERVCRFYREICDFWHSYTAQWWCDLPYGLWLGKGAPGAFRIGGRIRVEASFTNWSRWHWRRANRAREIKVACQKNITVKLVPPTVPHMCNPIQAWLCIHMWRHTVESPPGLGLHRWEKDLQVKWAICV